MREHLEKDYKDVSIDTISDDFLEGTLDLQRVFGKIDKEEFNQAQGCKIVRKFYEVAFSKYGIPTGFNDRLDRFELVDDRKLVFLDYSYYQWFLRRPFAELSHSEIKTVKEAFHT